jgi:hypothetical protein
MSHRRLLPSIVITALLLSSFPLANAARGDLVFVLTNATDAPVQQVHMSPTGANNWRHDLLKGKPLAPGASVEVTVARGRNACAYDLRFDFAARSQKPSIEVARDLCASRVHTIAD